MTYQSIMRDWQTRFVIQRVNHSWKWGLKKVGGEGIKGVHVSSMSGPEVDASSLFLLVGLEVFFLALVILHKKIIWSLVYKNIKFT